jgi:hypothetical protein
MKTLLVASGIVAVTVGAVADIWLVVMVAQQLHFF